jgi:hypothetical protein
MKVNGRMEGHMAWEKYTMLTDLISKDVLCKAELNVKMDSLFTPMGLYIEDKSRILWLLEEENLFMEIINLFMMENGSMINPMDTESNHIRMAVISKVISKQAKRPAKENTLGLMEAYMTDNSIRVICRDMEYKN